MCVCVCVRLCVCVCVCIGALERLNCVVLTSNTCNKHVQTNVLCLYVCMYVCARETAIKSERDSVGRDSLARLCQRRVDRFNHPTKNPFQPTFRSHTHTHTHPSHIFMYTYKATLLFYKNTYTNIHSSGKTYPYTSVMSPTTPNQPPAIHSFSVLSLTHPRPLPPGFCSSSAAWQAAIATCHKFPYALKVQRLFLLNCSMQEVEYTFPINGHIAKDEVKSYSEINVR